MATYPISASSPDSQLLSLNSTLPSLSSVNREIVGILGDTWELQDVVQRTAPWTAVLPPTLSLCSDTRIVWKALSSSKAFTADTTDSQHQLPRESDLHTLRHLECSKSSSRWITYQLCWSSPVGDGRLELSQGRNRKITF